MHVANAAPHTNKKPPAVAAWLHSKRNLIGLLQVVCPVLPLLSKRSLWALLPDGYEVKPKDLGNVGAPGVNAEEFSPH